MHVVHFDSSQKIEQIRLYWDQGSLLKLVDVIGSRARNWPIRDGKDQIRLITSSVAATSTAVNLTKKQMDDVLITSKEPSRRNTGQDDRSNLNLFAPRDTRQDSSQYTASHSTEASAPRVSAKPPPRDYHDLFVGNESDASPASKPKLASPTKDNAKGAKGGAGKHHAPNRLFETDESEAKDGSPQKEAGKYLKAHPGKYNHFEFDDGSNEPNPQPAKPRQKTKHDSQWDFEDFVTPMKVPSKPRPQDVRHFGYDDEEQDLSTPVKNARVIQPRRDADTHFELKDRDTPQGNPRPNNHRGQSSNVASGLYQNNLYDDTELSASPPKKPHPLVSANSRKEHHKHFAPHFEMTDSSPGLGERTENANNRPIAEARSKVLKQMDAQWDAADASPEAAARVTGIAAAAGKENHLGRDKRGIKIDGDGMGSRRGKDPQELANLGIKTGGDGMGGKKGAGRTWGFGDESDGDDDGVGPGVDSRRGRFVAGKRQQAPATNDGFWDF